MYQEKLTISFCVCVQSPEWWCCGQPGAEAWSPLCISVCLAMYHDKLIIPLCVCVFSLQNGGVVGSPVLKPGLLSVSLYVLHAIYHDKLIIPLFVCVSSLQNGGVVGSPMLKPGLLTVSLYVLLYIMTS